jgi:hypothetical protein
MEEYSVLVRNEMTGETTIVSVASLSSEDAQVQALTQIFRQVGWRKVCAFQPQGAAVQPQPA